MAQCVGIDGNGFVVEAATSASAPCTTAVILTPTEYAQWSDVPWNLSVEDGAEIGSLILIVWATAWGMRVLRLAFGNVTRRDDDED